MRFFSEFIVLYEDKAMPEPELFCPSFWQAQDFDADGNYYAEGIDGRWTDLTITRSEPGKPESTLGVHTHRERGPIRSGLQETLDLQRYLEYRRARRYQYEEGGLDAVDNLAVTALCFDTTSVDDYREFLESVHRFLDYTKGRLVNHQSIIGAEQFRALFLEPS